MKRKLTQEDLITWANKMAMPHRIAGDCLSEQDCDTIHTMIGKMLDIVMEEAEHQGLDTSNYK